MRDWCVCVENKLSNQVLYQGLESTVGWKWEWWFVIGSKSLFQED